MKEGRLRFTTDLGPAIEEAQAIFIAVGTPSRSDGSPDLKFIREVAASIAQHLNGYKVIVTKSTVPIGTGQMIESIVREGAGSHHEFAVVSNPEFLREGSAIEDFMHPDRVVIGTRDPKRRGADEGRLLALGRRRRAVHRHRRRDGRAHQVRLQRLPRHQDLLHQRDGPDLRGLGRRRRRWWPRAWGSTTGSAPSSCAAGPGFGGSCFPKDTRAAAQIARDQGLKFRDHRGRDRRSTRSPRSG